MWLSAWGFGICPSRTQIQVLLFAASPLADYLTSESQSLHLRSRGDNHTFLLPAVQPGEYGAGESQPWPVLQQITALQSKRFQEIGSNSDEPWQILRIQSLRILQFREFPGGLVVRTLRFHG